MTLKKPISSLSMADLIEGIAPYLHRNLVSSKALHRVRTLTRLLPPSSGAGLECPLDHGNSTVDFSLRVNSSDDSLEAFAGAHPVFHLPAGLLEEPGWQCIREFCSQWMGASPFRQHVENVWLEFDLDAPSTQVPTPSVFFDSPKADKSTQERVVNTALETLLGEPIPLPVKHSLSHCFDLLPPNAKIYYIGGMLSRWSDKIRLTVLIEPQHVMEYLARIGWHYPADNLHRVTTRLPVYADRVTLHLDVGGTIGPKIGIEVKPVPPLKWLLLLGHLVKAGLCTPQKRQALLAWPGRSDELNDREIREKVLTRAPTPMGVGVSSVFVRRLNHIKIVCQPNDLPEAKAYLYIGHGWIPATEK
jgi:hypothetical protein